MSDPKRYSRQDIYDVTYQAAGDECLPEPSEDGEFVRWEDFAALLATNERVCQRFAKTQVEANEAETELASLKEEVQRLEGNIFGWKGVVMGQDSILKCRDEEIESLKAKNEMLRKAGDEMAEHVGREWAPSWVLEDWKAAKDGTFTE